MTARKAAVKLSHTALTSLARRDRMRECGNRFRLPGCPKAAASILTTEKCAPLSQPIDRGVQLRDNCLGLIRDDDQLEIDLSVWHLKYLHSPILCLLDSKACSVPESRPKPAEFHIDE
jgi:hypothetical protein